ncbi:MAG TPA: MFS transporter [Treponemataceae bacterium]|nr:MFS transporter [Treponemataceae bacterium]
MAAFLLVIIYFAFISLGLPDGMLGAAWPVMRGDFNLPLGSAGFVSMTISASTILSALFSVKLIKKWGTGLVTAVSALFTAAALLGFSLAPSFCFLFLLALPLGLGAGAVDSGLNEYVAEHYKASHMNFLHSFWGVGALSGPVIMGLFLQTQESWRGSYKLVAIIQFVLVVLLFVSLPVWASQTKKTKTARESEENANNTNKESLKEVLRKKGVKGVLAGFMLYTGLESTMGLWGASYLKEVQGFSADRAAVWVSLYYGGITAGRFLSGIFAMKFKNIHLLKTGAIIIVSGTVLLLASLIPAAGEFAALAGFILIGLGCAPIFPGMLHETPVRFGKTHAQTLMGLQMAVAYTSVTLLPPLFGWTATIFSTALLPFFVFVYAAGLFILNRRTNRIFHSAS